MRISIIGIGEMGEWFAEFAENRGWDISLTDIDAERGKKMAQKLEANFHPSNKEAASRGDVVLISVPIGQTPKVIEEVSSSTKKGSLLVDIASVKERSVKKMREIETKSELASMHPLFGPGAKNLEGQNIITIPVKTGDKYDKFKSIMTEFGAKVEEMEASEHDKLMANIQTLTHSALLAYLSAFNSMDNFEKAIKYQTPMLKGLLNSCRAFLKEDPELCGEMQTQNQYGEMARETLMESCRSLKLALDSDNTDEIKRIFEESRKRLGMKDIKKAYKKLYEEAEDE